MAYIQNQDDEEQLQQQQQQAQMGAEKTLTPSSQSINPGQGTSSNGGGGEKRSAATSGWTNLQDYVRAAGDDSRMGSSIANDIQSQRDNADASQQALQNDISSKVEQNTVKDTVSSKLNSGSYSDISNEDFSKQYGAAYTGPTSATDSEKYTEAARNTSNYYNNAKLTDDYYGRQALLQDQYKGNKYSQGEKALDSFFAGTGKNKQVLEQTRDKAKDYNNQWQGLVGAVNNNIKQGQDTTNQTKQNVTKAYQDAVNRFENDTFSRLASEADAQNKAVTASDEETRSKALASLGLNPDEASFLAKMGITTKAPEQLLGDRLSQDLLGNYNKLNSLTGRQGVDTSKSTNVAPWLQEARNLYNVQKDWDSRIGDRYKTRADEVGKSINQFKNDFSSYQDDAARQAATAKLVNDNPELAAYRDMLMSRSGNFDFLNNVNLAAKDFQINRGDVVSDAERENWLGRLNKLGLDQSNIANGYYNNTNKTDEGDGFALTEKDKLLQTLKDTDTTLKNLSSEEKAKRVAGLMQRGLSQEQADFITQFGMSDVDAKTIFGNSNSGELSKWMKDAVAAKNSADTYNSRIQDRYSSRNQEVDKALSDFKTNFNSFDSQYKLNNAVDKLIQKFPELQDYQDLLRSRNDAFNFISNLDDYTQKDAFNINRGDVVSDDERAAWLQQMQKLGLLGSADAQSYFKNTNTTDEGDGWSLKGTDGLLQQLKSTRNTLNDINSTDINKRRAALQSRGMDADTANFITQFGISNKDAKEIFGNATTSSLPKWMQDARWAYDTQKMLDARVGDRKRALQGQQSSLMETLSGGGDRSIEEAIRLDPRLASYRDDLKALGPTANLANYVNLNNFDVNAGDVASDVERNHWNNLLQSLGLSSGRDRFSDNNASDTNPLYSANFNDLINQLDEARKKKAETPIPTPTTGGGGTGGGNVKKGPQHTK